MEPNTLTTASLTPDEQRQLLQDYEPVLRFSAGERFFPMDVLDFVEHSKLKRKQRLHDADVTDEWLNKADAPKRTHRWQTRPRPNLQTLANKLPDFDGTHYLSFGYHEKGEGGLQPLNVVYRRRLALSACMLVLVLVPAFGWLSDTIGLHATAGWGRFEWFKAVAAVALVVVWPYFQIDRKAYFAMALMVISCLLFGTPFGSVLVRAALAVVVGFLLAYALLAWGSRLWDQVEIPQFGLVVDGIGLMVAFAVLTLGVLPGLQYAWISGGPAWLPWTVPGGLIAWGLLTLLLWFAVGARIRRHLQRPLVASEEKADSSVSAASAKKTPPHGSVTSKALPPPAESEMSSAQEAAKPPSASKRLTALQQQIALSIIDGQQNPMVVLAVIILFEFVFLGGTGLLWSRTVFELTPAAWRGWEGLYQTTRVALPWLCVSVTSATAILWYAFDPLPIFKPGYLCLYDPSDRRLAWNWRVIVYCLVAVVIWLALHHLAMWLRDAGSIHQITLYYLTQILLVVFIALMLGMRLMSALLDASSTQPDLAADYVAQEYQAQVESGLKAIANKPSEVDLRKAQPCYYGRVWEGNGWTVLQYNYFYAFNDYRSTAGGLNNHEGDWESVAIYLRYVAEAERKMSRREPFGMAFSQHQAGSFAFWPKDNAQGAIDEDPLVKLVARPAGDKGKAPNHPLVYVALGSHANYPRPAEYPVSAHFSGSLYTVVAQLDKVFRQAHTDSGVAEPFEKKKRKARLASFTSRLNAEETQFKAELARLAEERKKLQEDLDKARKLPRRVFNPVSMKAEWLRQHDESVEALKKKHAEGEAQKFWAKIEGDVDQGKDLDGGLLLEYATGDGRRIGKAGGNGPHDEEFKFALQLPPEILAQPRETAPGGRSRLDQRYSPAQVDALTQWQPPHLLGADTLWVEFKGLWGHCAPQADEGGPSGPKWDRPSADPQGISDEKERIRLRWGKGQCGPLAWMQYLLLEMVNNSDLPVHLRQKALCDLVGMDLHGLPA